jgi:ankyrin repeat protein
MIVSLQVVAKMRRAHLDMVDMVEGGFVQSEVQETTLEPLHRLKSRSKSRGGPWFNTPANFKAATAEMFEARDAVFEKLKQAEPWDGAVQAATMCAREDQHAVAIALLRKSLSTGTNWKVELARWMVEQDLAPPWPATFVALGDANLAVEVAPLLARDEIVEGKRVLALKKGWDWKEAVVTRAGVTVDATADGWDKLMDLPRTHALVVDSGGAGALLRAASAQGSADLVDALISLGVSLFVADEDANTALHCAATAGHVKICRALVAAGADSSIYNKRLQAANQVAQSNGQQGVVRVFKPTLSDGEFTEAACAATPRLCAAAQGSLDVLASTQDEGIITALMVACRTRQFEVVQAINGALDAQSHEGCTALYLAAEEGDERIVRLLLERRANVSLAASDGGTPLHRASEHGHDLCARALLEAGSDPTKATSDGWTALMLASQLGHDLCVRALLEAGSDPNKATNDGRTALMQAA